MMRASSNLCADPASRCPMHPARTAPPATVRVGARDYCAACAEDMRATVRRSKVRDVRAALLGMTSDVEAILERMAALPLEAL